MFVCVVNDVWKRLIMEGGGHEAWGAERGRLSERREWVGWYRFPHPTATVRGLAVALDWINGWAVCAVVYGDFHVTSDC
jgi:hypothetical protein